jgi:hypothetical protein
MRTVLLGLVALAALAGISWNQFSKHFSGATVSENPTSVEVPVKGVATRSIWDRIHVSPVR